MTPGTTPPARASKDRKPALNQSLLAENWPETYTEARGQLVARSAPHVRAWPELTAAPLLWWDATPDDRWGDASSLGAVLGHHGLTWRRFGPGIKPSITSALRAADEKVEPGMTSSGLLVTSHRPLDLASLRRVWPDLPLAATGSVLVMGHPSLAQDIAELVTEAWTVCAVFDIDPEDLQAWLEFPADRSS